MPNHRNLPIRSLPMFTQFLSRKWHLRALMVRFNSKSQCWAGSMILGPGKRAMQFLGEDEKRGAGSSGCNSWKCRRGLNHRGYEKEAGWCLAWVGKYNFFWGDIQRWLIPSSITIYHQIFLSITIHHSAGRAGWKWVGRMNSNWWAVKKTTMVPSLTHVDISHVCKCRWLELENKQIVLGEIQWCSKRSVDITNANANADCWVWQMHNGQTIKSIYRQCANTRKSMRAFTVTCICWNVLSLR